MGLLQLGLKEHLNIDDDSAQQSIASTERTP